MRHLLLDFLYPPSCVLCARRLSRADIVCGACDPSQRSGETVALCDTGHCLRCGEPAEEVISGLCSPCFLWPMPVNELRSLWRYSESVAGVIKSLKYGERLPLARFFAEKLGRLACRNFSRTYWDLVLPLPSSPDVMQKRGFSHTGLICRPLAKSLGARWSADLLLASRVRATQTSLTPEQRIRNVSKCFEVSRRFPRGATVLLVDDVATTGASLVSAARALLRAGAGRVDGVTVARSTHFNETRREIYRKSF